MKWFPIKRRFLRGLSPSKPQRADLPVQHGDKYDEASGQVYTETSVPVTSSDRDWTRQRRVARETRGRDHVGCDPAYGTKPRGFRPSKGVRSLQDIAIDATLANLGNITAEYLESLPLPFLDRIWDEVEQR